MSMFRKFKIEDSMVRNIFNGSNMGFCMANVLLREVNKQRKLMFKDSSSINLFIRMVSIGFVQK